MNIVLSLVYLVATVTFIVGLKMLGHPATAKNGNVVAASGMGIAIVGTLLLHGLEVPPLIYILIGLALLTGGLVGALMAIKVKMTKMPELVSLFNGFGGASAALIGLVAFGSQMTDATQATTVVSGIVIGALTFSGSMIAWGKLDGRVRCGTS